MKKIVIILFVFISIQAFPQEMQLSNYWLDNIGQNPALVGLSGDLNLNILNRSQWSKLNGRYNHLNFNVDAYIPFEKTSGLGLGIKALQNQEGDLNLKSQKIEIATSYWKIFGRIAEVSIGFSSSYNVKSMNSNHVFSDQLDPSFGFIYPSSVIFDNYETNTFIETRLGGLAKIYLGKDSKSLKNSAEIAKHLLLSYSSTLNGNNTSFSGSNKYLFWRNKTIHASLNLNELNFGIRRNNFLVQPYILIQSKSYNGNNLLNSTTLGSRFVDTRAFSVFLGYRFTKLNDFGEIFKNSNKRSSIIMGVGFNAPTIKLLNDSIRINKKGLLSFYFSTDFNINSLTSNESGPSFEIGLNFKIPSYKAKGRGIRCSMGLYVLNDIDKNILESSETTQKSVLNTNHLISEINFESKENTSRIENSYVVNKNSEFVLSDNNNLKVQADSVFSLYVPNALYPDYARGNGLCKVFLPIGVNLKSYNLKIFDINGFLIWETSKLSNGMPSEGWNGIKNDDPLPIGVYIWKIEAEFLNGSIWEGQKSGPYISGSNGNGFPRKTGNVTLIR